MTGSLELKPSIDGRAVWEFVAGMPSDNLKSWACSYGGYSEDIGRSVCRLEVPKDRAIVILGFGDRLRINPVDFKTSPVNYQAFVVGLSESPLLVEHDGFQRCIEIELIPWAANKLFDRASVEFTQGVVALEDIWGNQANLLVEQLSQMSSWQKRFALVDQFFSARFAETNQSNRSENQWAWNQLEQYGGCISIQQLAKTLGWSHRYFAVRFREQIGITPKAAARRIRFTRAHRRLTLSDDSLSSIAATCGYSDQSHFTREFHLFSGCSPTIYKKARFRDLLGTPGEIIQG